MRGRRMIPCFLERSSVLSRVGQNSTTVYVAEGRTFFVEGAFCTGIIG